MRGWIRILAGLLALVLAASLFYSVWADTGKWQWDFRIYYAAAKADAGGLDPYNLDDLSKTAGRPLKLRFVYPPHALYLVKPFTCLGYDSAARAFLALKGLAVVALLVLLASAFLHDRTDALFYLFCLVAFRGALWLDVQAGNVAVFEQLALWAGLWFFLRGRLALFCGCVLVAASFKLAPVVFLALLLFTDDRRRFSYLAASALAFVAFLAAQWALAPHYMRGFVANLAAIHERGMQFNPSSLAFVQDVLHMLAHRGGVMLPSGADWAVYGLFAAGVLGVTLYFWRRSALEGEERRMALISLACLVTALVLPRFKCYSFVQVLLPTYLLMRRVGKESRVAFGLFFALAVLSDTKPYPIGYAPPTDQFAFACFAFFWRYYPILLTAAVWGLYLHLVLRPAAPPRGLAAREV